MAKAKPRKKRPSRRPQPVRSKRHKPKKLAPRSTRATVSRKSHAFPITILTVLNEDLGRLTPAAAVELLRDLLWADARRVGIPTTSINVSAWVDVPDGGIDASISADPAEFKGSALTSGRLGFQVKAGTAFQPWQESPLRVELFRDKTPNKTNLGASVRACLDDNGTYVLVCTGVDLTDAQQRQAVAHLKRLFAKCELELPRFRGR